MNISKNNKSRYTAFSTLNIGDIFTDDDAVVYMRTISIHNVNAVNLATGELVFVKLDQCIIELPEAKLETNDEY